MTGNEPGIAIVALFFPCTDRAADWKQDKAFGAYVRLGSHIVPQCGAFAHGAVFRAFLPRSKCLTQHRSEDAAAERTSIADELFRSATRLTEWDDSLMRQLLDTVTILSEEELLIRLYDGTEVSAEIRRE